MKNSITLKKQDGTEVTYSSISAAAAENGGQSPMNRKTATAFLGKKGFDVSAIVIAPKTESTAAPRKTVSIVQQVIALVKVIDVAALAAVQKEIDSAPLETPEDIAALKALRIKRTTLQTPTATREAVLAKFAAMYDAEMAAIAAAEIAAKAAAEKAAADALAAAAAPKPETPETLTK